jgi:hypothetical protein
MVFRLVEKFQMVVDVGKRCLFYCGEQLEAEIERTSHLITVKKEIHE